MINRMKNFAVSAMFALALLSSSAMAESSVDNACRQALEGKCFHGAEVVLDVTTIKNADDANTWCFRNFGNYFCSDNECINRVSVLAGIIPHPTTGNPCLPQ